MSSLSSKTQFSLIQLAKKDQSCYFYQEKPRRQGQGQGQGQNTPAIGINVTAIKKNKNKKDLTSIEYYKYKQKGYYINKCLEKKQKKVVLVLTIFILVIEDNEKAILVSAKKLK